MCDGHGTAALHIPEKHYGRNNRKYRMYPHKEGMDIGKHILNGTGETVQVVVPKEDREDPGQEID